MLQSHLMVSDPRTENATQDDALNQRLPSYRSIRSLVLPRRRGTENTIHGSQHLSMNYTSWIAISSSKMNDLVQAAWPSDREVAYREATGASCNQLEVLEITDTGSSLTATIGRQIIDNVPAPLIQRGKCRLSLVIIRRTWTMESKHRRTATYNITQEDLKRILETQGLVSFFSQTRADVAGLHTFALPSSPANSPGSEDGINADSNGSYLGLVYDATLGLWARYDTAHQSWQGIYMISDTALDFLQVAYDLLPFARSDPQRFMHLLAARLTVDFLSIRSGELPKQIERIEQHSGHHFSVLRPVPATYAELSRLTADATATANLVSHYKIVIGHLADDVLLHLADLARGREHDTSDRMMQRYVTNLRQRRKALDVYMAYLSLRAERQIGATQHLVAEANASTNLAVAHETQSMGSAARRDASSTKILTAVATTLLPGTFVATLFSMDMFDWFAKGEERVVSERLWVYWAVTVPLTLGTVGLWLGWDCIVLPRARRKKALLQYVDPTRAEDVQVDVRKSV